MTPAKMFDGDLWMLASDAVAMAENAYKKGQAAEREACAKVCDELHYAADAYGAQCAEAIRARGQA
jgi:hypothetical protein